MGPGSFRTPLTLSGRYVELIPLAREQRDSLIGAARDPEIGRYLRHPPGQTPQKMDALIEAALGAQSEGTALAFTTRLIPSHRTVGMTNYLGIDRDNHGVEIGGTWLDSAYWRTPVNGECKLLLLRHAFEDESAHRVQLQTDSRNLRSQRAIERLGAVREGVLREDVLLGDGYRRSSVYFSILATEWPGVKAGLEAQLARPWLPTTTP